MWMVDYESSSVTRSWRADTGGEFKVSIPGVRYMYGSYLLVFIQRMNIWSKPGPCHGVRLYGLAYYMPNSIRF